MENHYDIIVIGTGPAGQRAAVEAARHSRRVAVVERRELVGGSCLHVGTIPSKTLREAVLHFTGHRHRGFYGEAYRVKSDISMADLLYRINYVIQRELEHIEVQMDRVGVKILAGKARFLDAHNIEVKSSSNRTTVSADAFVVATGTVPWRPPDFPFNNRNVIDSDELFTIHELPHSLVIVGGGIIGLEYASIFATLGIDVTVVHKKPELLEFVDREILDVLRYNLREAGVVLQMNDYVATVDTEDPQRPTAILGSGQRIGSDLVMVTSGRMGTAAALSLEKAGVVYDERGLVTVTDTYQTNVAHIYAAGDIIGFPSLASTSMEQGRAAIQHLLGLQVTRYTDVFPLGIYTVPEISFMGKTEEELVRDKVPFVAGRARYQETAKGKISGNFRGLLKLLFHREKLTLLGVHAIGAESTEIIHVGQAVMTLGGTLDYFLHAVFNYPTMMEAYKLAALDARSKLA
jgi:NAD(P) transhydrogenase